MTRDPRGLAGAWMRFQHHDFAEPGPALAPFVRHFWAVEWSYDEPFRQLIVPYPEVHLTARDGGPPEVHGVCTGHVIKVLEGAGQVVGVAFRPGGFRPFLRAPVSALTNRTRPSADVLTAPRTALANVAAVEQWLLELRPDRDPVAEWVAGVVEQVAGDPGISRVDQLAKRCDCGVRRLQRLFAEYVGVSPKWVIRRYRLHEVTERMAAGTAVDWARLAVELGFADQAHLARDFAAMFGEPPTHYAARYPSR